MFKLGQKIKVRYIPSWAEREQSKVTKKGIVVFSNKDYFTVQFDNYKESFRYTDTVKVEVM